MYKEGEGESNNSLHFEGILNLFLYLCKSVLCCGWFSARSLDLLARLLAAAAVDSAVVATSAATATAAANLLAVAQLSSTDAIKR